MANGPYTAVYTACTRPVYTAVYGLRTPPCTRLMYMAVYVYGPCTRPVNRPYRPCIRLVHGRTRPCTRSCQVYAVRTWLLHGRVRAVNTVEYVAVYTGRVHAVYTAVYGPCAKQRCIGRVHVHMTVYTALYRQCSWSCARFVYTAV